MTWDVVVVGAGPAGTIAAEHLLQAGNRVLLVDAGPRPRLGAAPEVDESIWAYAVDGVPFDWLRVRAVGGRALLWGGWSYRFPDHVLRRGGWPYGTRTIATAYRDVERRLGVVEGDVDPRYERLVRALGVRILPKRGAMARHAQVWTPLDSRATRSARTRRIATKLHVDHDRGSALTLFDASTGSEQIVRARAFVLAASPIETARLLLDSGVGQRAPRIGRGLTDHMVASYLLIEPANAPPARGRGRFPGDALVETPMNTGPGTERPYRGGFTVELSGPRPLASLAADQLELLDVSPREARTLSATLIHAIGETFPHARRFVDLHPTLRDGIGRRQPWVHFAWSTAERRMAADMRRACVAIADELSPPGGRLVPFLDPLVPERVGHEAGTCAMGGDDAPCDPFGHLRALRNVWIADAAVMPTAGDRHPTLTVLAHAWRAARSVAAWLDRGA